MKMLSLFLIFSFSLSLLSCKVLTIVLNIAQPPVTQDLPLVACFENVEKFITLAYTHPDGLLASTCDVTNLMGATKSTPCSCDAEGVCIVGLTGSAIGVATFSFFVTTQDQSSNFSQGSLQITNSAPIVANLVSDDEFQMIEKIYTLTYTDIEGDLAAACSVSNRSNVTQTTPCSCNGLGICTVGMIGNADYTGPANFDYSVTTNGVESNTATISFTINQIGSAINDEWVKVPANAGNMGLPEFYVMKYEARAWMKSDGAGVSANEDNNIDAGEVDPTGCNGSDTCDNNWVDVLDPNVEEGDPIDYFPVSIATSQPWREIDADQATLRCQGLGGNYQLISNVHWMAIARDLENQPQNWTGNAVDSGCLFRGNNGQATSGDGSNLGDSCGYNSSTDPDSGTSRDLRASHTLSNGSQIFDLAGNAWEWIDWDKDTIDFQLGPTNCPDNGVEELPTLTCSGLVGSDFLPTVGTYTSADGIGQFRGGTGGATIRGGLWSGGASSGLFALNFANARIYSYTLIGFRCILVPSS